MTLSIIIVSYNVKYFLEQCLLSVQRAAKDIATEVIVIDNCSADGSPEYLKPLFPGVQFISNSKNYGFGKACNQGLRRSKGTFVLFLNPDTLVPEDCFEKCLEVFEQKEEVGALGIRMINGKGAFLKESKRGFPSFSASFFKLSGISRLFPGSKTADRYYLGHLDDKKDQYTEVLAGAFMLIPRRVLDKTGGFDEAFFMYGEDIDLSYRIMQAGYKNYYLSAPSIIHFKGESTSRNSLQYIRNFYRAMSIFVSKHYRGIKGAGLRLMAQPGIWGHAAFTFIREGLRSRKKTSPAGNRKIVVGTETTAARLAQQFFAVPPDFLLLSPGREQLYTVLGSDPSASVYLCEADLSFSELIRITEKSKHPRLYFYSGRSLITSG
ncbi:glycosyltransferase family 2 protein [Niabella beijingensis]|uniref:glycosyltransferase family 2 protein n=1 Tax=Niabella beijingensis TaxID=2872700 RepID=UPI001CBEBAB7|nr:glycosyltransferase family 2 protein [Niabella beijingensis]MBZ4189219.1 glycosyltransferase family 2 protein [Niabella beijingensis]